MQVSNEGRRFIESFEGYSADAYLCPAGVPTIGFGHTAGVNMGDRLGSREEGDALLAEDLRSFAFQVTRALDSANTDQQEFDAMVSLAFNIGIAGFTGSTVLRMHKEGKKPEAARAFSMWNKATVNGVLQEVPGLTRRRAAEAAVYLTPDESPALSPPAPVEAGSMPQAIAPPPSVASSKTVIAGGVSVAAGAATVADQINQVTPIVESISTVGASFQNLLKLGAVALSVVALCAVAYMLYRYVQKRRNGDVIST